MVDVASRPAAAISSVVAQFETFIDVHEENARLRARVEGLTHWQAAARRLAAENGEFRELLATVAEPRAAFVTARVVGMSSGTFARTALINAGARDGVDAGQAAVTSRGVFGRVVEVAANSSRVLLLTDLNSRVPVVLESSRVPAVVAGDNSETLTLHYVGEDADVAAASVS